MFKRRPDLYEQLRRLQLGQPFGEPWDELSDLRLPEPTAFDDLVSYANLLQAEEPRIEEPLLSSAAPDSVVRLPRPVIDEPSHLRLPEPIVAEPWIAPEPVRDTPPLATSPALLSLPHLAGRFQQPQTAIPWEIEPEPQVERPSPFLTPGSVPTAVPEPTYRPLGIVPEPTGMGVQDRGLEPVAMGAAAQVQKTRPSVTAGDRFVNVVNSFFRGIGEMPAGELEAAAIYQTWMQEAMGQLEKGTPVTERWLYQQGQDLRQFVHKQFPLHPELQDDFLMTIMPAALGSFAAFIFTGKAGAKAATIVGTKLFKAFSRGAQMTGRAAGTLESVGAMMAAGSTAGALGASQMYNDALAHGASEDVARKAALQGHVPGVIQVFPVMRALGRYKPDLMKPLAARLKNAFLQGTYGAVEEAIVESLGQVGYNEIARRLYDDDRRLSEGLAVSAGAGGGAGFIASFVMSMLGAPMRGKVGWGPQDASPYGVLGASPLATESEINSVYQSRVDALRADDPDVRYLQTEVTLENLAHARRSIITNNALIDINRGERTNDVRLVESARERLTEFGIEWLSEDAGMHYAEDAASYDATPLWRKSLDQAVGNAEYATREYYDRRETWENEVFAAIARGELTADQFPDDFATRMDHLERAYGPMPEVMYHVTTARSAVEQEGLKTRAQLSRETAGLGGGADNTISFTTNAALARDIQRAIHDVRAVLNEEISISELIEQAKRGDGANAPFWEGLLKFWHHDDPTTLPPAIEALLENREIHHDSARRLSEAPPGAIPMGPTWRSADGELLANVWSDPATQQELDRSRFEFVRRFIAMREAAGGPADPLFFGTSPEALKALDPAEIAILGVRPRPGAQGYRMEGMNEWRTWDGSAVEIIAQGEEALQQAALGAVVPPLDFTKTPPPAEPGYRYHATNRDNFHDIRTEKRLQTFAPDYGTPDQRYWPDGSDDLRSYWASSPQTAASFHQPGEPVLIRVAEHLLRPERDTGDFYASTPIATEHLEYLGEDNQWHNVGKPAQPEWQATADARIAEQPVTVIREAGARYGLQSPVAFANEPHLAVHRYWSPRQKALTPDEKRVREIAYGLQAGEAEAVQIAAHDMAPFVRANDILVPVPSSQGQTTANLALAETIQREAAARGVDVQVEDLLLGQGYESQRERAMRGARRATPDEIVSSLFVRERAQELTGEFVLIDNVRTTGATIEAARMALPRPARSLVYAKAQTFVDYGFLDADAATADARIAEPTGQYDVGLPGRWRSPLLEAVEKGRKKETVEGWINYLNPTKRGFSQQELAQVDLRPESLEWIVDAQGNITKEMMLKYVKDHLVRLQEWQSSSGAMKPGDMVQRSANTLAHLLLEQSPRAGGQTAVEDFDTGRLAQELLYGMPDRDMIDHWTDTYLPDLPPAILQDWGFRNAQEAQHLFRTEEAKALLSALWYAQYIESAARYGALDVADTEASDFPARIFDNMAEALNARLAPHIPGLGTTISKQVLLSTIEEMAEWHPSVDEYLASDQPQWDAKQVYREDGHEQTWRTLLADPTTKQYLQTALDFYNAAGLSEQGAPKYEGYKLDIVGQRDYGETVIRMPVGSDPYYHIHWEGATINPLVHTRHSMFDWKNPTTGQTEKVFFIGEMQADIHQIARDRAQKAYESKHGEGSWKKAANDVKREFTQQQYRSAALGDIKWSERYDVSPAPDGTPNEALMRLPPSLRPAVQRAAAFRAQHYPTEAGTAVWAATTDLGQTGFVVTAPLGDGYRFTADPTVRFDDWEFSPCLETARRLTQNRIKEFDAKLLPDYPYKTTEDWTGLIFRRALQEAVAKGATRIAWVTGEQAADSFDLRKFVDKLEYNRSTQYLVGYKAGNELVRKVVPPDGLAEHISKEVSQRLLSQPGETVSVEGDDLAIGAQGMIGYYNEMVPKIIPRTLKRDGMTARIEPITVPGLEPKTVDWRWTGPELTDAHLAASLQNTHAHTVVHWETPHDEIQQLLQVPFADRPAAMRSMLYGQTPMNASYVGQWLGGRIVEHEVPDLTAGPTNLSIAITPEMVAKVQSEGLRVMEHVEPLFTPLQPELVKQTKAEMPTELGAEHRKATFGSLEAAHEAAKRAQAYNEALRPEGRMERLAQAPEATHVDVRGHFINTDDPGQMAANTYDIAAPFRDPKMEIFQAAILDDAGRVVSHTYETSGAIDYVFLVRGPKSLADRKRQKLWLRELIDRAKGMEATRIVLAHNHPSGFVKSSKGDRANTIWFAHELAKEGLRLEGHVIIDHNTATVMMAEPIPSSTGAVSTSTWFGEQTFEFDAGVSSPWLLETEGMGQVSIGEPKDIAAVVRQTIPMPEDGAVLFWLDLQNRTVAAEVMTPARLANLTEWFPQMRRALAAPRAIFAVGSQAEGLYDHLQAHIASSELVGVLDIVQLEPAAGAVRYSAATQQDLGIGPTISREDLTDLPSRRLREEGAPYDATIQPKPAVVSLTPRQAELLGLDKRHVFDSKTALEAEIANAETLFDGADPKDSQVIFRAIEKLWAAHEAMPDDVAPAALGEGEPPRKPGPRAEPAKTAIPRLQRNRARLGALAEQIGRSKGVPATDLVTSQVVELVEDVLIPAQVQSIIQSMTTATTRLQAQKVVERAGTMVAAEAHRRATTQFQEVYRDALKTKMRPEFLEHLKLTVEDIDLKTMSVKTQAAFRATHEYLSKHEEQYLDPAKLAELKTLDAQNLQRMDVDGILYLTKAVQLAVKLNADKNAEIGRTLKLTRDKVAAIIADEASTRMREIPAKFKKGQEKEAKPSITWRFTVEVAATPVQLLEHMSPTLKTLAHEDIVIHAHHQQNALNVEFKNSLFDAIARTMPYKTNAEKDVFQAWLTDTVEVSNADTAIRMSRDDAIGLYLTLRDPNNRKHAFRVGFTLTDAGKRRVYKVDDALIESMTATLGEQELVLADAIFDMFNGRMKEELNKASVEKMGFEIADRPDYYPRTIDLTWTESGKTPLERMASRMNSLLNSALESWGHLKERKGATGPLEIGPATRTYLSHSGHVARIAAYMNPVAHFNSIMGRPEVHRAIVDRIGEAGYERLLDMVAMQSMPRAHQDSWFRNALRLFGTSTLGIRISTWLLNPSGLAISAAHQDNGFKHLAKALAAGAMVPTSPEWKRLEALIREASPYYDLRYDTFTTQVTSGALGEPETSFGRQSLAEWSLQPLQFSDKVGAHVRVHMAEQHVRETRPDLEVGSEAYLYELGRQWERLMYLGENTAHGGDMTGALAYGRKNAWFAPMVMFTSSVSKIYSTGIRTLLAAQRGDWKTAQAGFTGLVLSTAWVAMVREVLRSVRGGTDDEDESFPERLALRSATEVAGYVPIVGHTIISPFIRSMAGKPAPTFSASIVDDVIGDAYSALSSLGRTVETWWTKELDAQGEEVFRKELGKAVDGMLYLATLSRGLPYGGPKDALRMVDNLARNAPPDLRDELRTLQADADMTQERRRVLRSIRVNDSARFREAVVELKAADQPVTPNEMSAIINRRYGFLTRYEPGKPDRNDLDRSLVDLIDQHLLERDALRHNVTQLVNDNADLFSVRPTRQQRERRPAREARPPRESR